MKLLLDTQAFIYFTAKPDALPAAARMALEDPANELVLSIVTPWEMQIKVALGKVDLRRPPTELVQFEIDRGALSLLPITLEHIGELARLPSVHRDPFDRLLIAQARVERLKLVSGDQNVHRYPVECLWD